MSQSLQFSKGPFIEHSNGYYKKLFIEMHYKMKCHVTRLIFKNLQAMTIL
jgi:hypothetical protein